MSARPRIHWVSPLPPAETDIAHYTARTVPALAERADVVLWTDQEAWDGRLERHAIVRRFDGDAHAPLDLAGLAGGREATEAVFFHIGNSWLFHAGILKLARRIPGCVVLHDIGLQDLAWMMMENGLMGHRDYRAEMRQWYGAEGGAAANRVLARERDPADVAVRFPLFEIALPRAVSALTHTGLAFDAVAARGRVPVYALDLPFEPGPRPAPGRPASGPLRLVQFGYINPNRRLDSVLEALAEVAPEIDFTFEIFGKLWDRAHVERRISRLGLSDRVAIRGFAPEAELDEALGAAHLVFNLRFPTMGEASGSQLRIWRAAAASAVTDHGWYADQPDDTLFKLAPGSDREGLVDLLRRIEAERGLCERVGAAGRACLEARHDPDRYAAGLVAIAGAFAEDMRQALTAEVGRAQIHATRRRRELVARRMALLVDGKTDA